MSNILQDLCEVRLICQMDDVLIFGSDEQEHDRRVCARRRRRLAGHLFQDR